MDKKIVIESCYSQLRKVTPLCFDCGKICNCKCCKGDDETGMLVFPGEEDILDKSIAIFEKDGLKLAVCSGSCDRNKRPLACRIYPFFPLVKNVNGKKYIEVKYDVRAIDCPLKNECFKINKEFLRKLKRVGKYLLLNNETSEFLEMLSNELIEIENLKAQIFKT